MPIAKVWVLILRDRTLSKQCTEKLSCVESLIRLVRDFDDVKAVLIQSYWIKGCSIYPHNFPLKGVMHYWILYVTNLLDCLQSAFSLKIRIVLSYRDRKPRRYAKIEQKEPAVSYLFFSGLRPRLSRLACSGFSCSTSQEKNETARSLPICSLSDILRQA